MSRREVHYDQIPCTRCRQNAVERIADGRRIIKYEWFEDGNDYQCPCCTHRRKNAVQQDVDIGYGILFTRQPIQATIRELILAA